jgi:hypothetical protein
MIKKVIFIEYCASTPNTKDIVPIYNLSNMAITDKAVALEFSSKCLFKKADINDPLVKVMA